MTPPSASYPGRSSIPTGAANYTSYEFGKVLAGLDLRRSMGRTGVCYDNAMAESFFAALKNELCNRTVYPTRVAAMKDIARYIETRYIPEGSTPRSDTVHQPSAQRLPNTTNGRITTTESLSKKFRADHVDYIHKPLKPHHTP